MLPPGAPPPDGLPPAVHPVTARPGAACPALRRPHPQAAGSWPVSSARLAQPPWRGPTTLARGEPSTWTRPIAPGPSRPQPAWAQLPSRWRGSGAAPGTRVPSSSARQNRAARPVPSLASLHLASALRAEPALGPAREAARHAARPTRCAGPARARPSLQGPGPDRRTSGSTAARGPTGRASAQAANADAPGLCVDRAAVHGVLRWQRRLVEVLPTPVQRALSTRSWNLWISNAPRHRRKGLAGGAGRGGAASCVPVDAAGPAVKALPMHLREILEPHGTYCLIQTARPGRHHQPQPRATPRQPARTPNPPRIWRGLGAALVPPSCHPGGG